MREYQKKCIKWIYHFNLISILTKYHPPSLVMSFFCLPTMALMDSFVNKTFSWTFSVTLMIDFGISLSGELPACLRGHLEANPVIFHTTFVTLKHSYLCVDVRPLSSACTLRCRRDQRVETRSNCCRCGRRIYSRASQQAKPGIC